MKDSGGIHNTTLEIGPPAQFMHAGRYICLVNNPEGHAHKEIFVRVLTDSQLQRQMSGKPRVFEYTYISTAQTDLSYTDLCWIT